MIIRDRWPVPKGTVGRFLGRGIKLRDHWPVPWTWYKTKGPLAGSFDVV